MKKKKEPIAFFVLFFNEQESKSKLFLVVDIIPQMLSTELNLFYTLNIPLSAGVYFMNRCKLNKAGSLPQKVKSLTYSLTEADAFLCGWVGVHAQLLRSMIAELRLCA